MSPAGITETGECNPRIAVQKRAAGVFQTVKDAAVYILHLPASSPGTLPNSLSTRILAELRAHMSVLRADPLVTLILTPCLLPEPGTVDPAVEATARSRDLSQLQLANEREMEMGELVELVNSFSDGMGWLVVVNKLRLRTNVTVALGVKYQAHTDRDSNQDADRMTNDMRKDFTNLNPLTARDISFSWTATDGYD